MSKTFRSGNVRTLRYLGSEAIIPFESLSSIFFDFFGIGAAKYGLGGNDVSSVDEILRIFARSIFEKAAALQEMDLTANQRRRLKLSLKEEVKTCGGLLYPEVVAPEVSVAALNVAKSLGIRLHEQTWRNQGTFDKGRSLFHWEHVDPVSCIRHACEKAKSSDQVFRILRKRLRIAWILKSEDRELTRLGYKSRRPDPDEAYRAAKIDLIRLP